MTFKIHEVMDMKRGPERLQVKQKITLKKVGIDCSKGICAHGV